MSDKQLQTGRIGGGEKRELAAKQWPDMDGYANAKTEVIESTIAAAEVEGEITPVDQLA